MDKICWQTTLFKPLTVGEYEWSSRDDPEAIVQGCLPLMSLESRIPRCEFVCAGYVANVVEVRGERQWAMMETLFVFMSTDLVRTRKMQFLGYNAESGNYIGLQPINEGFDSVSR